MFSLHVMIWGGGRESPEWAGVGWGEPPESGAATQYSPGDPAGSAEATFLLGYAVFSTLRKTQFWTRKDSLWTSTAG